MARGADRHNLRDKTAARVNKAVAAVEVETEKAVATVSKETKDAARSLEHTQIYGAVARISKDLKSTSTHLAATTQHELSSAWRIVALTVWAELLFVLLTHTHYHQKYQLGSFKWSLPFVSQAAYSITLPNATIWWRAAFLKPFGLCVSYPAVGLPLSTFSSSWIVASVLLPLVFAQLIVFPRPELHRRSRRRHDTLEPASPVTFSIARLAVSFFLLKVAPLGISSDWRFIASFGDLQLLASTIGLAFSVYEALAI